MLPDLPTEPLRQLYTMTAYLTDEDRIALVIFCEQKNIPLEFIED